MSEPIICVNSITKSYVTGAGRNVIFNDFSLNIQEGEFASIMGPSGCGKSTLLYMIGGLDAPDSGTITVCGKNIHALSDEDISKMRREEMGFIFQFFNLVQNLTVEENILLPALLDGKDRSLYEDRVTELLETVGLSTKRDSYPDRLSGGEQQRCAIARALLLKPRVILADEPTGNLDSKNSIVIMETFKKIKEEYNVTILQVTHSLEMGDYGDRIINLF